MKLIYNNFDAFDLTFQGMLPESILNQLAEAKERAYLEKTDVCIELGDTKIKVMVAPTGKQGGFKYRFNTGIDGEIWAISHSQKSHHWGITVSVSSLGLALSGLEAVISGIIKRLEALKAIGLSRIDSATGKITNRPLESINRFDYCFDFIMPSAFKLLPNRFIAHQRANKHVYGDKGTIENYNAMNGDKINTIRIGQMPNRQAVIYNKCKEINAHSKQYWWHIWGLDKYTLKKNDQIIWRVEIRAGKKELDKWGLKTFDDLNAKAGDVIKHIIKSIRYTKPLIGDDNRARWPISYLAGSL